MRKSDSTNKQQQQNIVHDKQNAVKAQSASLAQDRSFNINAAARRNVEPQNSAVKDQQKAEEGVNQQSNQANNNPARNR